MNSIFKKIPGFVSLIPPFRFHFQTIKNDTDLPFDPKLELTLFSKTESGFRENKIRFRDIKEDVCPLHFVKGNIHFRLKRNILIDKDDLNALKVHLRNESKFLVVEQLSHPKEFTGLFFFLYLLI